MRYLRFAPLILLALSATEAWAKKVSVEWKPIKGAVSYEIQIKKDGKVVAKKEADENNWSGNLEVGLYTYQIRAVDRVGRPGKWTKVHALIAMPKAAENVLPKDGQNLTTYTRTEEAEFKWSGDPGRYRLVVKKMTGKKSLTVIDELVNGLKSEKKNLAPGKYEWHVTRVVEARGLASLEGKKWEGKASDDSDFEIEKKPLVAPDLVFPQGLLRPRENGKMQFRWEPVKGAEAYEVHFQNGTSDRKWITTKTTSTLPLTAEGNFHWRVRALASLNSKQIAEEVGEESHADFSIDRNASFKQGMGDLVFSTFYSPYNYQINAPSRNISPTSTSSAAVGFAVGGDYWLGPQFGVGLLFQDTFYTVNTQSIDTKDVELAAKYRTNLSRGPYGWTLLSHVGIESRDYAAISPQYSYDPVSNTSFSSGTNADSFGTSGPTVGVEIKKQFTDNFSLSSKLNYYLPMTSGVVRGGESNRNFGLGVQASEWLAKRWAIALGLYVQNKSIEHSDSSGKESISMDGKLISLSLIYSFGR